MLTWLILAEAKKHLVEHNWVSRSLSGLCDVLLNLLIKVSGARFHLWLIKYFAHVTGTYLMGT